MIMIYDIDRCSIIISIVILSFVIVTSSFPQPSIVIRHLHFPSSISSLLRGPNRQLDDRLHLSVGSITNSIMLAVSKSTHVGQHLLAFPASSYKYRFLFLLGFFWQYGGKESECSFSFGDLILAKKSVNTSWHPPTEGGSFTARR